MAYSFQTMVAGHVLAVAAACVALSVFDARKQPPLGAVGSKAVSSARVGASMLAIMLAFVAGIALNLHHPLALFTAALVASGWIRFTLRDSMLLTIALVASAAIDHWM